MAKRIRFEQQGKVGFGALEGGAISVYEGDMFNHPRAPRRKAVFEGEIGVVIGKKASNGEAAAARDAIFGCTVINDVTAAEITNKDPPFAQWTRAKGYDAFGVCGPVIGADADPARCSVKTLLTPPGSEVQERQNYPVSAAFCSPVEMIARLSNDVTLQLAGNDVTVIARGPISKPSGKTA